MEERCIDESDVDFFDQFSGLFRRKIDIDSESLQDVGTAGQTGDGTAAVLGDGNAGGCGDQCCRGGNIVGGESAAGPAGIHHLHGDVRTDRDAVFPHGPGDVGSFLKSCSLHNEGYQKSGDLPLCKFVLTDIRDDLGYFFRVQIHTVGQLAQNVFVHDSSPF